MESSENWRYPAGRGAPTYGRLVAPFRELVAKVAARGVLVLLLLSFLAVAAISLVGIGASVAVVETVRGSGSAINAAGNLRRLVHRAAGLAIAAAPDGGVGRPGLAAAVAEFEAGLAAPSLRVRAVREPAGAFATVLRRVEADWHGRTKPKLVEPAPPTAAARVAHADALLADVDTFAAQVDTLVTVLERDADGRLDELRTTLALAMAAVGGFLLVALHAVRRRVFVPLRELRETAVRIAGGDRGARSAAAGADELGQVGAAFNAMADRLSGANRELERRVADKTADLTRSNRALELLYHVISRLYHAPASPETYAQTAEDLAQLLGLGVGAVRVLKEHGRTAETAATDGCARTSPATDGDDGPSGAGRDAPWEYRREAGRDVLLVPLRDGERLHGTMRLALADATRLEPWQHTLVEAVSRHMGIALGISHQSARERLLALQEERSIIARELHDSLAQSLSYMKIQASLLAPALDPAARRDEALDILADLREGINAAYRQLRELLSTFRLRIEGDFARLLGSTVEEYAARGAVPIELDVRLAATSLNPNQEIHVLHIVREALSNATRHAAATRIAVELRAEPDGNVLVVVEDDGRGIDPQRPGEPHHYGLAIMGERARGLGGALEVAPRAAGGTRVAVRFDPRAAHDPPEAAGAR